MCPELRLTNRDYYIWVAFNHFVIICYFCRLLGSIENWLKSKTWAILTSLCLSISVKRSVFSKAVILYHWIQEWLLLWRHWFHKLWIYDVIALLSGWKYSLSFQRSVDASHISGSHRMEQAERGYLLTYFYPLPQLIFLRDLRFTKFF